MNDDLKRYTSDNPFASPADLEAIEKSKPAGPPIPEIIDPYRYSSVGTYARPSIPQGLQKKPDRWVSGEGLKYVASLLNHVLGKTDIYPFSYTREKGKILLHSAVERDAAQSIGNWGITEKTAQGDSRWSAINIDMPGLKPQAFSDEEKERLKDIADKIYNSFHKMELFLGRWSDETQSNWLLTQIRYNTSEIEGIRSVALSNDRLSKSWHRLAGENKHGWIYRPLDDLYSVDSLRNAVRELNLENEKKAPLFEYINEIERDFKSNTPLLDKGLHHILYWQIEDHLKSQSQGQVRHQ